MDTTVLPRILAASDLDPGDTVVEVGPGLGALTRLLVQRTKRVIAIEMDRRLADSLAERLGKPHNLRVIHADAREVDLGELLDGEGDYKMLANLPYYAANPIMRRFLESEHRRPTLMVVMVQKEVARSMVADGGRMSLLAVAIQVYGVPRIVCDVPSGAFSPPPKVTSAVVRIDLHPEPCIEVEHVGQFFHVVRAGFSAPRKQLRNSLSLGLETTPEKAERLLARAGLDSRLRAEKLDIDDWRRLYLACREG